MFWVTHLHNRLVRALVIIWIGVIILGLLLMVVVGSVRLVFGAGNVRQLWLSLRWDRLNLYLIFHDNKNRLLDEAFQSHLIEILFMSLQLQHKNLTECETFPLFSNPVLS